MREGTRRAACVLMLIGGALAFAPLEQGCGGGSSAAGYPGDTAYVEPERENPARLEAEQRDAEAQLSELLASPEAECGRACELGDVVCDLRERICGIADRHPADGETQTRCTDARERCDGARERIAARCTCETL